MALPKVGLRFTPFLLQLAKRKDQDIKQFLPKLCREMFAKWGAEAAGKAGGLVETKLKDERERMIFSALGEFATARHSTLEEFEKRVLSLDKLAESASEISRRTGIPKEIEGLENFLKGKEFEIEAKELTEGRELLENGRIEKEEEMHAHARRLFPGYAIYGDAEIRSLPEGNILVINAPSAEERDKIVKILDDRNILAKGQDGTSRSPQEYFEEFGLNVLISLIEGKGISYSRLTVSGDIIISLAKEDDPAKALDDALVRVYFAEEGVIRHHVRKESMPELLAGWDWINNLMPQYRAGALGELIQTIMSDHWVLNKTVLAFIGKGIGQRLRGSWLNRFGELDLTTEMGIKGARRIITAEMVQGGTYAWWSGTEQSVVLRELGQIALQLVARKDEILSKRGVSRPLIVSVRTDFGEQPPPGFNYEHPNSLVFDPKTGEPFFVQWDLPPLGEAKHGDSTLFQRICKRDGVVGTGTTVIAPTRSSRPQPEVKPMDESVPADFQCKFCDPNKVSGPIKRYERMSPQQWLALGPYAAQIFAAYEYSDRIGVFSGTNPFAFLQNHRMILTDVHPRSHAMVDFTPAMIMALYHGTNEVMRDILNNFANEGITQVSAGQNFGTAEKPFPAGATFMHPHAQVGAEYMYSPHVTNALARRVSRYYERGIDFLGGYLEASRKAGLVIYENQHAAVLASFAPYFKDELQVMAKRPEAGNPLMIEPEEEAHINFSIALGIFGLSHLRACGEGGVYVPVGLRSFNTFYMGRRTTEWAKYAGLRMIWTIVPRQSHIGLAELQGQYVVDRDPADTADLMRKTLNSLALAAIWEEARQMSEDDLWLLAEFVTRRPDFGRIYEFTEKEQFDRVIETVEALL